MVKNSNKVQIIRCYASMKYSSSVRASRHNRSARSLWSSRNLTSHKLCPASPTIPTRLTRAAGPKQLNKHGSPRKFMMSSSISSTIKEVQGSSSGQKVQQVLTLSKLTGSTLQFLVGWLVSEQFSRITAPRIFPIFCMNVPYYKGKKTTRPFFREKSGSLIIHENRFWPFSRVWDLGWTQNCILW